MFARVDVKTSPDNLDRGSRGSVVGSDHILIYSMLLVKLAMSSVDISSQCRVDIAKDNWFQFQVGVA